MTSFNTYEHGFPNSAPQKSLVSRNIEVSKCMFNLDFVVSVVHCEFLSVYISVFRRIE